MCAYLSYALGVYALSDWERGTHFAQVRYEIGVVHGQDVPVGKASRIGLFDHRPEAIELTFDGRDARRGFDVASLANVVNVVCMIHHHEHTSVGGQRGGMDRGG
jgi:hypothetical protein